MQWLQSTLGHSKHFTCLIPINVVTPTWPSAMTTNLSTSNDKTWQNEFWYVNESKKKVKLTVTYLSAKFQYLQICFNIIIKGYLAIKRYLLKICHLRHRLRIFLFRRKIMFRYQDIQIFLFWTIPWFTKIVTSWWVLVHETGCISEYIFRTTTH